MIKQRIFTLLLVLYISSSHANEGISFFKGSWSELLAAAKQQGKFIFVDVYTDWCPPCKQMDKYVLPDPEVGNKYNATFISYKLDAEKGEGISIANKYSVKAYPTYLYLDPEGYLLHRAEGYFAPAPFIAQAERALSLGASDNPVSFLEKEFKEGNRNPSFLRNYIQKMSSLKLDNTVALNAYFIAMPVQELARPGELVFLGNHISSIKFQGLPFLLEHYPLLKKEQQQELATRVYAKVVHNAAGLAWKEGRTIEMQQLINYMNRLRNDIAPVHHAGIDKLNLLYYGMVKNQTQLKKTGYAMVKPLLTISTDSIRAEDKRQYQKLMRPFLTGEMDSTKVVGFQEEKKFIQHIYAGEISNKLYEVAIAFAGTLDMGDSGLADALKWINRAAEINPDNEAIKKLVAELEERVDPKATPESTISN
jgi:thiol-disulfide isomerase/thioredoxin